MLVLSTSDVSVQREQVMDGDGNVGNSSITQMRMWVGNRKMKGTGK